MPRDRIRDSQTQLGEAIFDARTRPHAEAFAAERSALRDRLAEASGISDETVLTRLVGLEIRPDTLAALTLIPLVEVAWADARMDAREREAVLAGAESTGIREGTASHGLLRIWLADRPPTEFAEAWTQFIGALCRELSAAERAKLRDNILARALRVAEAAGEIRGSAPSVSEVEREVLARLERAFDLPRA